MAYAEVEPFGEERADLRMAIVAHTIYCGNRGKGSPAMTVKDFMPDFSPRRPRAEELAARFDAMALVHNRNLEARR